MMDERLEPIEFFQSMSRHEQLMVLEFVTYALRHNRASTYDIFVDMDVSDDEIANLAYNLEQYMND